MKGLYKILPPFAPDYGGACEVMFELGGLVLIHDASGCTVNYVHFDEPRWCEQPSNVFCSGLSEIDAVMGDDSVVINKAIKAAEVLKPNFIAFVGSSVPMVVGTDFEGIAMECENACGIPCFGFPANGIRNYTDGASRALMALIKRFCGNKTDNRGTNVLGLLPMGFSSVEETRRVKRLIEARNDGPVISPGFDMGFEQLGELQNAAKNLVVSAAGLEAAKYMEKKYGIPYEIGIPYAPESIRDSIDISVVHGKVLIIGEGMEAVSFGEAVCRADALEEGAASIQKIDFLDLFGDYERASLHTADETEIKKIAEEYDCIIADPCFAPLVGKNRLIPRPSVSISGY